MGDKKFGFWGIMQGAGEETEESWLCFCRLENDFQNELSNCTLDSLVHLKQFKASSAGISGYRGCNKCLIMLYDSCAIA